MPKIFIIMGSTRPNRISEKIAEWVFGIAKNKKLDVELIDLRDWQLPFYNEIIGQDVTMKKENFRRSCNSLGCQGKRS